MKTEKVKITVFVEKEVWEKKIQPLNHQPGIRRDELLSLWLDSILKLLENQPTNTLPKKTYRLFYDNYNPIDKKKVNLTLNRETLTRLDTILAEKNIERGFFLSVFLDSLDELIRNLKYQLDDPYFEYRSGGDMKKPRCLNLFPTDEQTNNAKRMHKEFLDIFNDSESEFQADRS